MPLHYFHIRDGCGVIRDDKGSEFESLSEAHHEAFKLAKCVAHDLSEVGDVVDGQKIEVCYAAGKTLEVIGLNE